MTSKGSVGENLDFNTVLFLDMIGTSFVQRTAVASVEAGGGTVSFHFTPNVDPTGIKKEFSTVFNPGPQGPLFYEL